MDIGPDVRTLVLTPHRHLAPPTHPDSRAPCRTASATPHPRGREPDGHTGRNAPATVANRARLAWRLTQSTTPRSSLEPKPYTASPSPNSAPEPKSQIRTLLPKVRWADGPNLLGSPPQSPPPPPPPQSPLHSLLQLRLSGAAEAYYHRLLAARSKPIETLRLLRALQTKPGDGARGARGSPRGGTSRGLYCGTQDAGFEEFSPRDGMLRSHTT